MRPCLSGQLRRWRRTGTRAGSRAPAGSSRGACRSWSCMRWNSAMREQEQAALLTARHDETRRELTAELGRKDEPALLVQPRGVRPEEGRERAERAGGRLIRHHASLCSPGRTLPVSPRASTVLHFTPPSDAVESLDRDSPVRARRMCRSASVGRSGGDFSGRAPSGRVSADVRSRRPGDPTNWGEPSGSAMDPRSAAVELAAEPRGYVTLVERSGGPRAMNVGATAFRLDPVPPKEAPCCRPPRRRPSSRTSSPPRSGCVPRSRAWSPDDPSSSASPSRFCSPRGTCCSRTCRASARPRSRRRWRSRSTARSGGSSSRRTCCPRT